MELFGVGGPELLVLLLMGGVVLGPRRLAGVARKTGRFFREIQDLGRNITKELDREIGLLESDDLQQKREQTRRGEGDNPPAQGEDDTPRLPQAYQRFREDFPDEGRLDEGPQSL